MNETDDFLFVTTILTFNGASTTHTGEAQIILIGS